VTATTPYHPEVNAKDLAKEELEMVTERLPRSHEEWMDVHRRIKWAVRAVEMVYSKEEGSEEKEAVRLMIRYKLRNEDSTAFQAL
jgi:hypothetical protein